MKSADVGTIGALYIPCLYFFPATLLGLGESGIFIEPIPEWYKVARFMIIFGLIGCCRSTINKTIVYLTGLFIVSLFHFDVKWMSIFTLSVIIVYTIINYDFKSLSVRHFYIIAFIMILTAFCEMLQFYESPHSYDGVTRVVSIFGGPNNAGIISAAFCLFFFKQFTYSKKLLDFVYSALSLLILFLTGSISSLIAFIIVSIYVERRFAWFFLLATFFIFLDTSSYIFLKFENIYDGFIYGEASLSRTTVDRLDMVQEFLTIIGSPYGFFLGADYVAESDYLNIFGRFGIFAFLLFLMFLWSFNFSIYLSLGLIQSLFTPFWFSFPSLSVILFISEYVRKNGYISSRRI